EHEAEVAVEGRVVRIVSREEGPRAVREELPVLRALAREGDAADVARLVAVAVPLAVLVLLPVGHGHRRADAAVLVLAKAEVARGERLRRRPARRVRLRVVLEPPRDHLGERVPDDRRARAAGVLPGMEEERE